MASGDNVDTIEVVEMSFGGPARNTDAPSRTDDSGDEDGENLIFYLFFSNFFTCVRERYKHPRHYDP